MIEKLSGFVPEERVRKQIGAAIPNRLPEALFASAVVLVEGETDEAVLEGSATRDGAPLAVEGVHVAEAGHKTAIYLSHAILTLLGIPCFAVFDADAGVGVRMEKNGGRSASLAPLTCASTRRDYEHTSKITRAVWTGGWTLPSQCKVPRRPLSGLRKSACASNWANCMMRSWRRPVALFRSAQRSLEGRGQSTWDMSSTAPHTLGGPTRCAPVSGGPSSAPASVWWYRNAARRAGVLVLPASGAPARRGNALRVHPGQCKYNGPRSGPSLFHTQ
ncbi:TOPRIM nucleotidyl transferase/hydrolase domain-containing protein [Streptomyces sp. NPDC056683]|uniref:TOPRIM nucleotidyl transferase/hydrolase domain-containing protein n=1 Tax=Streptomyces sp. NPDC056683 TaxID=3345910 RepID=UPI0036B33762